MADTALRALSVRDVKAFLIATVIQEVGYSNWRKYRGKRKHSSNSSAMGLFGVTSAYRKFNFKKISHLRGTQIYLSLSRIVSRLGRSRGVLKQDLYYTCLVISKFALDTEYFDRIDTCSGLDASGLASLAHFAGRSAVMKAVNQADANSIFFFTSADVMFELAAIFKQKGWHSGNSQESLIHNFRARYSFSASYDSVMRRSGVKDLVSYLDI